MKASILIPTYNRLHFLKKTLSSLKKLTMPVQTYEVIVIDDGSEDGTHEFLKNETFPFSLRCLRQSTNRFAAAARNAGILEARGEYIVFLDDDMEVVPEFLDEHMRIQGGQFKTAVVGNIYMHPDVARTGINKYLSTRGIKKLKPGQPMPFQYWCSGNASIHKSILLEIGLFDEKIIHYGGEDLELSYRLFERGDILYQYASKAVSYHMHFREFDEVCQMMYDYGRTSLAYMIRKHPHLATIVKADLMDPFRFGQDPLVISFRKGVVRAAMNPFIYGAVKRFAERSRSGSPAILYDYVIAYNYLLGLKHSQGTEGDDTMMKEEE